MNAFLYAVGWYRKDQELIQQLEKPPESILKSAQEALSYLKTHASPPLQKALQTKLHDNQLQITIAHLLQNAPDLLETCCKVALIETADTLAWAGGAALYLPKPKAAPLASRSLIRLPSLPLGIVGKVVHFLLSTIALAYAINFEKPPKTRWDAQSQWMFLRGLVSDLFWIKNLLLNYFESKSKTAAVAGALLALGMAGKFVLSKFDIARGVVPASQHFQDLTKEELPDVLVGREEELHKMHCGVSPAPGEKPRISILIGPPGSGKTEMVTSYAQKIRRGEYPQQKGMQVLAVNTEFLTGWGKWDPENDEYNSPLDRVFKEIEGKEDKVILFFDEFQNAAAAEGLFNKLRGAMLEELKTKLLQRNVRCILATTDKEYTEILFPHTAFLSRTTPIHLASLKDDLTEQVLRQQENSAIAVPEAVITTLATAKIPGVNPRKALNLRTDAVNYVYNWTPTGIKNQLSWYRSEIEKKRKALHEQENEGEKTDVTALNALLAKQKELETKLRAQLTLHAQFLNLKKLQLKFRDERNSLVHRITQAPSPAEAELKAVAWIKDHILPTLGTLIQTTKEQFQKDFTEEIPEIVTPAIVGKLAAK